jgi:hypothetical protein
MTDSLADLLKKRQHNEPPEISVIKQFLNDRFQATGTITIRDKQIIIGVSSAALAGTLRMHLHELQELCKTDKRLVIRIG